MLRMLPAPLAELRKFEFSRVFAEIFAGIIIKPLAVSASKLNEFFGKFGLRHARFWLNKIVGLDYPIWSRNASQTCHSSASRASQAREPMVGIEPTTYSFAYTLTSVLTL